MRRLKKLIIIDTKFFIVISFLFWMKMKDANLKDERMREYIGAGGATVLVWLRYLAPPSGE